MKMWAMWIESFNDNRLEEIKKDALLEVNRMRLTVGAKPLANIRRGVQNDGHNCPITNSLRVCGVTATSESTFEYDTHNAAPTPTPIALFVKYFDKGCYKELIF